MLSEELVDLLPDTPTPEKLEAWYHSEVTKHVIESLKVRMVQNLELMAEVESGNPDYDFQQISKYQGEYKSMTDTLDWFDSFAKPEGDDNEL